MNTDPLNDTVSSYSEGTPIVNKIDQNYDIFSQLKLNSVLVSPRNERRQSLLKDNEMTTLQNSKTIKLDRKQTINVTNEETLILPNSKQPIRIYTIYEKDKTQINEVGESQIQKEINLLKSTRFDKPIRGDSHQSVPHPSLPQKIKRSYSGDVVKYQSLLQVLDDEYRQQLQQDQIPSLMIAQGVTPNIDGRRRSQLTTYSRKLKKENNLLQQKFLVMRQQRKKKKQVKQQRRKSCTCQDCGGANTTYQMKYNDMAIETTMSRKIKLANLLIDSLKSKDIKPLNLKKEKSMTVIKAALEKTFMDHNGKNYQSDSMNEQQILEQEQTKFDRRDIRIQTKSRSSFVGDLSPEKNTPASRMTDQDYKERLTQTDLDNYKYNRNKSNYSRSQENIKRMRKTMIQYNIIESLTDINECNNKSTNNLISKNNQASRSKSEKKLNKNENLSLRNLNNLERQTPEKKANPYQLKERYQRNSILKPLPPKIILRSDLQNLIFKQSNVLDKMLDEMEPTVILEQNHKSQRLSQSNYNNHSKRLMPNSCIELQEQNQKLYSSMLQQKTNKQSNQLDNNQKPLSSSNINKYSALLTPIKQKQLTTNYSYSNNNLNDGSSHFLQNIKEMNVSKQNLLNNNIGEITPLRNKTPHRLPQIEIMNNYSRK